MFIQTEETPNPSTLKFIPGKVLLESGTQEFKSKKDAKSIELSSNIFEIIKELEALPTEVAVNILKKEIQTLF